MGALGDYVHLRKQNYLTAGTYHIGQGENKYQKIHNYMESRVVNIKDISSETLETLKSRIKNDSQAQQQRDKNGTAQDFQEMLNDIYKVLYKTSSQEAINELLEHSTNYKLPSSVKQELDKTSFTEKEIQQKKAIKKEINSLIDEINKQDREVTEKELKKIIKLYDELNLDDIKFNSKSKPKSVLGKVQSMLTDLTYNTAITHIKGAFGEELVYRAKDVSDNLAMNEATDLIQKVVGQDRSEIKINPDLIVKDIVNDKILNKDALGNSYSLGVTQNKVDVQIVVNQEDVFATVKTSANLTGTKKSIKLQNSLGLLSPLLFLNTKIPDFGNHWLNMHALHNGKKMKTSESENADEVLQQELAYEALSSGNPFKQSVIPANVFVAIDRKSGKVEVTSTKDILLKRYNRISLSPKISNLFFENKKSPKDYSSRISYLISQVHKVKFYTTMKVDI